MAEKTQMQKDLDELHEIVKKLNNLLEDRQIGLGSWHNFLCDRLTEIRNWFERWL